MVVNAYLFFKCHNLFAYLHLLDHSFPLHSCTLYTHTHLNLFRHFLPFQLCKLCIVSLFLIVYTFPCKYFLTRNRVALHPWLWFHLTQKTFSFSLSLSPFLTSFLLWAHSFTLSNTECIQKAFSLNSFQAPTQLFSLPWTTHSSFFHTYVCVCVCMHTPLSTVHIFTTCVCAYSPHWPMVIVLGISLPPFTGRISFNPIFLHAAHFFTDFTLSFLVCHILTFLSTFWFLFTEFFYDWRSLFGSSLKRFPPPSSSPLQVSHIFNFNFSSLSWRTICFEIIVILPWDTILHFLVLPLIYSHVGC